MAFIIDLQGEVTYICSGTVVAPRLILTAGHCAESLETGILNEPSGFRVVTGSVDWADESRRQVSDVTRVLVYPGFNRSALTGDAALLELSAPTSAPAIGLATDLAGMPGGTEALIAGWGDTYYESETPELLRWAGTVVQGPEWCTTNDPLFYAASNICTINPPAYDTGTCHGDSGGPLLARWPAGGEIVQIGITSSGPPGCATTRPDTFTRSDLVASWVNAHIADLRRQEEEAAAAQKQHEEEAAAAAAAQKQHEEEAAAAAAAQKQHEEEAAAAAAAQKQHEEEATAALRREEAAGGIYRGTTSQSETPIALVVAKGGRRITGLTTTLIYRCRGGRRIFETFDALSAREPERVRSDRKFAGTFAGNPREAIKGSFDSGASTVRGTIVGIYRTGKGALCSTGRVAWSASRQPSGTASLAPPGHYRGTVDGRTRISLTVGPSGEDLVGLRFTALYHCGRRHQIRRTTSFLSRRETQRLGPFNTFTMYLEGPRRYKGQIDGALGLAPKSAFGTLEASFTSKFGQCRTGLVYWYLVQQHGK